MGYIVSYIKIFPNSGVLREIGMQTLRSVYTKYFFPLTLCRQSLPTCFLMIFFLQHEKSTEVSLCVYYHSLLLHKSLFQQQLTSATNPIIGISKFLSIFTSFFFSQSPLPSKLQKMHVPTSKVAMSRYPRLLKLNRYINVIKLKMMIE